MALMIYLIPCYTRIGILNILYEQKGAFLLQITNVAWWLDFFLMEGFNSILFRVSL